MEYATTELFGGHVTVELPEDWIDASTRQPVPDNQEAFLTPTGPLDARLIFEIAEYITPREDHAHDHQEAREPDLDAANNGNGNGDGGRLPHSEEPVDLDLAAVKYYVDDLVTVTDDDWTSTNPPRRVSLTGSPSMAPYPAYYLDAHLQSRSSGAATGVDNAHTADLPRASFASTSSEPDSWLHVLFVRVPQHGAEFVVQMIVKDGARHSANAEQVMLKIAGTLEFHSFDALVG